MLTDTGKCEDCGIWTHAGANVPHVVRMHVTFAQGLVWYYCGPCWTARKAQWPTT